MSKLLNKIGIRTNKEFVVLEEGFHKKLKGAVDDALLEQRGWFRDEVLQMQMELAAAKKGFGSGFFEEYASINEGTLVEDKEKYKNIKEGTWASLGLSPYQDPRTEQTIEELRMQQQASRYQWAKYPIARSEIENVVRYTLGRGVKITCTVPEVEKVIKNFWRWNKMDGRVKDGFRTELLDGEYFPVFFNNVDETFNDEIDTPLIVRSFLSDEIEDIEVDSDDRETVLAYRREVQLANDGSGSSSARYYLDISHPFGDEDELGLPSTMNRSLSDNMGVAEEPRLMFFKRGPNVDPRGRVLLEPVLRWNRVAVDFLYTRSRLNHLRGKIFMIETRTGSTGTKIATSPVSVQRMPAAGVSLIENSDQKFRFEQPNTGADDAEVDYRMILYMIGSALSMPLHVLQVNAENENYASIKEAGTPFVNMIADMQDDLRSNLQRMLSYLIQFSIRKGILGDEYTIETVSDSSMREIEDYKQDRLDKGETMEQIMPDLVKIMEAEKKKVKKTIKTINIPIDVIFPSIVKVDVDKNTRAVVTQVEAGLTSTYTGRIDLGRDPEVEKVRVAEEAEEREARMQREVDRINQGASDFDKSAGPSSTKTKLPPQDPNDPDSKSANK